MLYALCDATPLQNCNDNDQNIMQSKCLRKCDFLSIKICSIHAYRARIHYINFKRKPQNSLYEMGFIIRKTHFPSLTMFSSHFPCSGVFEAE